MEKRCSKCGEAKPTADFHRESCRADGLRPQCKRCTNAQNNARAAANRPRKSEYDRQRRAEHAAQIRVEKAAYYATHRDQIRERTRANYFANRDRNLQRARARHRAAPEPGIYRNMLARCLDPTNAAYAAYGGRGITVCGRWRDSFENFFADVGRRPSSAHTIDRIDNDRGYEPGNVRWATASEQARNRRSSRRLTIQGTTCCLTEWATRSGVDYRVIRRRLAKGWDVAAAVFTPTASGRRAERSA